MDGFRGAAIDLSPIWLQGPNGEKYMYSIGIQADALQEKLVQAVHSWMPGRGTPSALAYIGADRLIAQGITETSESYAARLQRAFDSWQRAGNAWSVLQQVLGYLLSTTPAARTVSTNYDLDDGTPQHTLWQYYDEGADTNRPPQFTRVEPAEWDWDSLSPTTGSWHWVRWYLVLAAVAPTDWTSPAPKLGEFGATKLGQYSGSLGCTTPSSVGRSLRIVAKPWVSGHLDWFVISFDGAEFRPGAAVQPDGYYGFWSKLVGGVFVASRSANGRYFTGNIK